MGWLRDSTGPRWLYRRGAKPLYRFIEGLTPDVVVATEVGVAELAALHKRAGGGQYRLVGVELMDFNQAWVQPEVDLYLVTHEDLGAELVAAGAARAKIVCSGQPLNPAFAALPSRDKTRARLGIEPEIPVLLVLFGGTGFGKPREILNQLQRLDRSLEVALVAVAGDAARCVQVAWPSALEATPMPATRRSPRHSRKAAMSDRQRPPNR